MFTIRKVQIDAFRDVLNRREALPAVRARLCKLGLLREGDTSTDERILADIHRAQSLGLSNESALVQLCSYGFHFPGWQERPSAAEIFSRPGLPGEERLSLLHRLLSNP